MILDHPFHIYALVWTGHTVLQPSVSKESFFPGSILSRIRLVGSREDSQLVYLTQSRQQFLHVWPLCHSESYFPESNLKVSHISLPVWHMLALHKCLIEIEHEGFVSGHLAKLLLVRYLLYAEPSELTSSSTMYWFMLLGSLSMHDLLSGPSRC